MMNAILQVFCIALACATISAQITYKDYKLKVVEDVTLESPTTNYNYLPYLIVGWHPGFPKKRSLLRFENIPSECDFPQTATLHLYFVYAHKASYMTDAQVPSFNRLIVAHTVRKSWSESQATSRRRFTNVNWASDYLQFGTDADKLAIHGTWITPTPGHKWYTLDVIQQALDWRISGLPNYGLLLRDTHEVVEGRDFRFASNAYGDASKHAYITVNCAIYPKRVGEITPLGGNIPI